MKRKREVYEEEEEEKKKLDKENLNLKKKERFIGIKLYGMTNTVVKFLILQTYSKINLVRDTFDLIGKLLSKETIELTPNLPLVNVPVLSLAIKVHEPKPSIEASFLTMTCFLLIAALATDRTTVIATGRPSGIAETAKATATKKISSIGIPR